MKETQHGTRRIAVLKVWYLLAVMAVVFALPALPLSQPLRWFAISALAVAQGIILLAYGVAFGDVARLALRLKWLFVFLIGAYALLPPAAPSGRDVLVDWHIPGLGWALSINLSGLKHAGLMCLQIITVLLTSAVVRLTGRGRDLIDGLQAFRLPALFVHALDRTLALLDGSQRRGRGARRAGDRASRSESFAVLRQILRGDVGAFADTIRANIALAEGQAGADPDARVGDRFARDVAVITGIALCMASLKMLKILPGLPFASGHKTFLLFPLYVVAARLTRSRWGATAAGSIMGVIGFLQGDGRFGALEIIKHIAPGVIIDLGEPLVRRWPSWALGYCVLGFFAAIARTATEFAVVLLLGARAEIYLFPAVKLVPNLIAGVLSGFAAVVVLRVVEAQKLSPTSEAGPNSRALHETATRQAAEDLGGGRSESS